MTSFRIDKPSGVDFEKPVNFTFDGRAYRGFAGDTVASALLANGVHLFGRSFKYHQPRGVMGAHVEEANALITIGRGAHAEPNLQATTIPVTEGMEVYSQNRWPSLKLDLLSINQLAAPLLSAGFYYKTFMGPTKRSWMLYEPFIRRAAGLGAVSTSPDDQAYEKDHRFCDVLIIGGGVTGIAAGLAAARSGLRVILVDDRNVWGGQMAGVDDDLSGQPLDQWISHSITELQELGAELLSRTTAFGVYDGHVHGAVQRLADVSSHDGVRRPLQRFLKIVAKHSILATGAFENPMLFRNNSLPGVMLADTARHFMDRFSVACGKQIVIYTNNDSAYGAASRLAEAGLNVAALIDTRPSVSAACQSLAKHIGASHLVGWQVEKAHGRHRVKAVSVCKIDDQRQKQRISSDCLAISGGWNPVVHLASHMGMAPVYSEPMGAFIVDPDSLPSHCHVAGPVAGTLDLPSCVNGGFAAGMEVARQLGSTPPDPIEATAMHGFIGDWPMKADVETLSEKAMLDFQNDVTLGDIKLAVVEGYSATEHLKRYTTLGMGTDQGRTSNINAISLLTQLTGQQIENIRPTRFRPPFTPITLGALVGHHVGDHAQPTRLTPMHDWHAAQGAMMVPVGLWWRPRAYLKPGETLREAYIREAGNVRENVGICDVSTLGKIAVQGPDAGVFLDRVYTNNFATLPVGKARYGLMLRDDGMVLDDGTSWRLGENDYLMTTTTGGAGAVMQHLERLHNLYWPDLRVSFVSVTGQWAGMSVAGPKSRQVLGKAFSGTDFSDAALPIMGVMSIKTASGTILVARLSFSGELAYEVFCPACMGTEIWCDLLSHGADFGIQPYGTEALGALRIEKGHVAGGELDGRVSPYNLRLDGMLSKKKWFFGKPLLERDGLYDDDQYRLVGLISEDRQPLQAGAHVVFGDKAGPGPSQGWVSSVTYSPSLDEEIGLALVKKQALEKDTGMYAANPVAGIHRKVRIVSHHFLDPEGHRMRL